MNSPIQPKDVVLPGGAMRVDTARVPDPGAFLFDPASPELHAVPVTQGGRQAAWFVQSDFGGAVLRHYRRGGLIARLVNDHYVWTGAATTRSFAEFDLLSRLYAIGLAVPRPIAAAYWRHGPAYRAALLVERIVAVQPLATLWQSAKPADVAKAIFDLHEAGVWHADLNAYNILLDAQGKVWLIDFDKGRSMTMSPARRRANLLRLRRSMLKLHGEASLPWWNALNSAYAQLTAAGGRP